MSFSIMIWIISIISDREGFKLFADWLLTISMWGRMREEPSLLAYLTSPGRACAINMLEFTIFTIVAQTCIGKISTYFNFRLAPTRIPLLFVHGKGISTFRTR